LIATANGRLMLTTHERSERRRWSWLLMFRYGFLRWGIWIPAIAGDAVYPDFIRGGLRIHAGWDQWIGYELQSHNAATDDFLRRFYERHCSGGQA